MNCFPVRAKVSLPILIACTLAPCLAFAQNVAATPAGVLWETTSQMTMVGMPYAPPAQKLKVCAKADATEPPGSANDERGCVNSDMQRDGQTVTWHSVCTGPPEMTGEGTITYTAEGDAYEGSINYATDEGNIVIALTGKRLPETCPNPR